MRPAHGADGTLVNPHGGGRVPGAIGRRYPPKGTDSAYPKVLVRNTLGRGGAKYEKKRAFW